MSSCRSYALFGLLNVIFFVAPLSCNFYAKDVKLEAVAQKISDAANQISETSNSLAVTVSNSKSNEQTTGANNFGISVSTYNGLYEYNSLQLSDGVLTDDLSFFYGDQELNQINYVLTSDYFSNHQGLRGILFDKYELYLYRSAPNTSFLGTYDNFCYITERTAKLILASNPNLKSYDDIISTTLNVKYGDTLSVWKIGNIVLEQEETYEQLSNIYNDFLLAYKYLPDPICKQIKLSAYFGTNTYFNIEKIGSISKLEGAFLEIYRKNLGGLDQTFLDGMETELNELGKIGYLNVMFYFEVAFVVFLEALFNFWYLKKHDAMKLLPLLGWLTGSLIVTYVPFWLVYKATANVYFLSNLGVLGLLIAFFASALTTIAFRCYQKRASK